MQTPYGNKTSVSVDKETQMIPQKANTPLKEIVSKETEGTVVLSVKTGTKRKKKRRLFEYDKARLHPPVLGMTEEEMLRRGPVCKDCHKEHYGQVCPCNKCGWICPHHGCLDGPFTPEEIPTITEVPPEDSETKEIKLTVPIKGKHWCWLCKSHGPEKVCPRKDEIGMEYGRQRLKELLQEMVKSEEKPKLDKGKNGKIPEIDQRAWVLEVPPLEITKKEFVGPKVVQPPEGKIPSVKSIELGGGAQWPSKPITSTPSRHTGSSGGQPPGKSTQGTFNARGRGNKNEQEEEQPPSRPPPRENGGNGGNGNGGDGGDDNGDDDDEEDDEDDNDNDDETKTVTESESGENPNAPVGGGAPGGYGGRGDEPPPNLGVGNVGPRGRRGHRGQRG